MPMQRATGDASTPAASMSPAGMHTVTGSGGANAVMHDDAAHDAGHQTPNDAGAQHDGGDTIMPHMIDRSALTDVGTDKPLDYSDPNLWLCRPGNMPNECERNLDATELLPDGSRKLEPHVFASNPPIDCFYVYPTVKLTDGIMTDFSIIDPTLDPLLDQAAPFTSVCRMYAPLYRQAGVTPGMATATGPGGTDFSLGLSDVRDAFQYYLTHLSHGRKFVIMGHSQGSGMTMMMMASDVDPKPELRARLISALLIGGGFVVPEGKTTGGTFQNIPICTHQGEYGCVIAYSSYAKEDPAMSNMLFRDYVKDGMQLACTEPAALAGNIGNYRGSYIPTMFSNSGFTADGQENLPQDISTRFIVYRDVFSGACEAVNGYAVLDITLHWSPTDPRPVPPYRNALTELSGLGLHLRDYALELDDLIDTVRMQAEAAGH
jgi:hypothetical protein